MAARRSAHSKRVAVVVATEAPEACRLLGLPAVRSKQAACVWYSAPAAPVDGRSIVLDGEASGPVANLAVVSTIAPTYAPEGEHLIAAACPGTAEPGIEVAVRSQMMGWFGPAVERWRHLRTYLIDHAQPDQRPPFHPSRRSVSATVATLRATTATPRRSRGRCTRDAAPARPCSPISTEGS